MKSNSLLPSSVPSSSTELERYHSDHHGDSLFRDAVAMVPIVMLRGGCFLHPLWCETNMALWRYSPQKHGRNSLYFTELNYWSIGDKFIFVCLICNICLLYTYIHNQVTTGEKKNSWSPSLLIFIYIKTWLCSRINERLEAGSRKEGSWWRKRM